MRINRDIRALKVRLIGKNGEQIGIVSSREALALAQEENLDLVEIAPNAEPPVCKIIDYGKFRYDQTKKEKESKKSQHQVKVKEVKISPNITEHDFEIKMRKARVFLEKGCKVKVSCFFRGREMMYIDRGRELFDKVQDFIGEICVVEASPRMFGRTLTLILAPSKKKQ